MVSEIELEIGPGAGPTEFTTRVVRAAAGGEPTARMRLDVEQHLRDRDRLENTVLASAVSARRVLPAGEQYLRQVGQELFDSLFVGPVYGAYRASLGVAQQEGVRLRIVLRLTAPELAALPWEALFDQETGRYICRNEPLVRHVPAPFTPDPLEVVPPLKVLGLVASPRGMPPLDVPAEQARLSEALAGPIQHNLITLEWLLDATWAEVHARLLSEEWHVLHFVGHGDYDVSSDQGLIALEGPDGRADLVEAERLADLFGEAQPTPRLVVLNSCSGGESGAQDLFSGTAAALVRSGICAVAAMQFTVSDDAAIAFARGFYAAIAAGRGVDEATRSGRIAILGARHTLEWVTPVLYVRGDATRLFNVAAPPPPDPAELDDLYERATTHLRHGDYGEGIAVLDHLLTRQPHYRDGEGLRAGAQEALREDERRRGRIKQLQEQLHAHVDTEDWDGALQVDAQLASIDESATDPSGLATVARRALEARRDGERRRDRIRQLEEQLRAHAAAEQWEEVLRDDEQLTSLDAATADSGGLASKARSALEAGARMQSLEERYQEALAQEVRQDWAGAIRAYGAVMDLDPAFREAASRRDVCLRQQRRARLQWLALGAVVVGILVLVLARASVLDAVAASRRGQLNELWTSVIWLLPCVPLVVAVWLLLVRRRTGIALGCLAAAGLWVGISWALVQAVDDDATRGATPAVQVLMLALLSGALAAVIAAHGPWEPPRLNEPGRALIAAALVAAAILLRTLNVHLADLAIPTQPAPIPLGTAVGTAAFWIAVLVPLAIGIPASVLSFSDEHATALKTLVSLQLAFEVTIRAPVALDADVARGDVAGAIFLLGTVCLLLAVWTGQWRKQSMPARPQE